MIVNKSAAGFREVSVERVRPNPDQPRKFFDEEALDELAASIRENGLLQPVAVRKDDDGGYVIVAGERRWRAVCRAGMETVTVRVVDYDDEAAFMLSVSENVNRADMTVMEEVDAYARLRDEFGRTVEEIAARFGKGTAYVRTRLDMANLIPEAKQALSNGVLQPNLARFIAGLNPTNQRTVLRRQARGEFANEIEAATFARALRTREETEQGEFSLEQQDWPTTTKEKGSKAPTRLLAAVETVSRLTTPEALERLDDESFEVMANAVKSLMKAARAAEKHARVQRAVRDSALDI